MIWNSASKHTILYFPFPVIGLYYVLYLPSIIETQVDYDESIKFYLGRLLWILFYASCVASPVVYVWQDKNFKEAFKKLLHIKSQTIVQNLTNSRSDITDNMQV